MEQISVLLAVCLLPAALNDISMYRKRRVTACVSGNDADRYEKKETWLFAAVTVAVLTVYGGLRTSFNDTYFYIHAYERLRGFESFSDMDMSLGANPGFFFLNALLSEAGLSFHWLLLLTSFVSQFCVIWFFRRYSPSMTMSVLMYICSGAYLFSLAADQAVRSDRTLPFRDSPYAQGKKIFVPRACRRSRYGASLCTALSCSAAAHGTSVEGNYISYTCCRCCSRSCIYRVGTIARRYNERDRRGIYRRVSVGRGRQFPETARLFRACRFFVCTSPGTVYGQ